MAIDRGKIVEEFATLAKNGDGSGLLSAFDMLMSRTPVALWDSFTERVLRGADDRLYKSAEKLLETAAAEHGYHAWQTILSSEAYQTVVGPMIEQWPEDGLHSAYAVLASLGWCNSEIVELEPGARLVVRAHSYYHEDNGGYRKRRSSLAYLIRGASRAFMDIAYGPPYPNGLGTFKCEQANGIETGDSYGEFVITRA